MLRTLSILLLLVTVPVHAQKGAVAKISVAEPTFNFGTVTQGSKVKHTFAFENTGSGELLIEKAVPACGCTVSKVAPALTPPGKKGEVEVVFDTTGFSGRKAKTVRLYTNDPRKRYLTLTVKGEITADVSVEPKQVFLNDVVKDGDSIRSGEQKLRIRVQGGSSVSVGSAKTFSEYLEVSKSSGTASDKTFIVRVLPSAPIGEIRDSIIVSLKGSKRGSLSIPVYASVAGVLQAAQSVVSFGVLEGTEMLRRSVKIKNRGAQRASFEAIESTNPAVEGKLVEINSGKDFVLHIDLDPSKVVADLKATVSIRTKEASIPALPISVVGILPPR